VYELLPPASEGAWTEAVLHSFSDLDATQNWGLTMGPNGSLYGVTDGAVNAEDIIAFRLDPPTGASTDWAYSVISQFPQDSGIACGSPVFGAPLGYGQSLYGIMCPGDVAGVFSTVYRLTPPPAAGGAWTETTLYTFPGGSHGSQPVGGLAVGAGGALFGVTSDGGYNVSGAAGGYGTVFSLAPPTQAGGPWTEAILHAFNPGIDGAFPVAGLIIGPDGVLYGTTPTGSGNEDSGVAFSLAPPTVNGAPMTETILHVFGVSDGDGRKPDTPLVLGPNGVLFGTTAIGGVSGYGTVFELAPPASPGGSWTETILYSFASAGYDEGEGRNGLALAPDGTVYATSFIGGTNAQGTVWALTP
jgi:hypothetical protein